MILSVLSRCEFYVFLPGAPQEASFLLDTGLAGFWPNALPKAWDSPPSSVGYAWENGLWDPHLQNNQNKMDWRCGSSSRVPIYKLKDLSSKPHPPPKKMATLSKIYLYHLNKIDTWLVLLATESPASCTWSGMIVAKCICLIKSPPYIITIS
jgi:hypothetical protein